MPPGITTATRMPASCTSWRRPSLIAFTACFVALYTWLAGPVAFAATLDTFTMVPPPFGFITRTASRHPMSSASTFVSSISRQWSTCPVSMLPG